MSSKFYEKQWFMWIMLIFLAPVGIYLLWKYNRFSKTARKIIAVVFGVFWIFAMIGAQSDRKDREAFNKQQEEIRLAEKESQKKIAEEKKEQENKKKAEEETKKVAEEKTKQEELNNRSPEQIVADVAKKMFNNRYLKTEYEDDKKTKLILTLSMAENLTNNMMKRGMILDAEKITKELCKYEKFKTLNNFTVLHVSEFVDAYGNKKSDNAGIISLTMADINKINWDNFITDNLPKIAKSYYVHPAFNK